MLLKLLEFFCGRESSKWFLLDQEELTNNFIAFMRRRFLGKMRGLPLKCLTTFVILHSGYLSGLAANSEETSLNIPAGSVSQEKK